MQLSKGSTVATKNIFMKETAQFYDMITIDKE